MSPCLAQTFFVFLNGDKVMCKDIKITAEQLAKAMDVDYQKLVQQVTGAVPKQNLAPVTSLIKKHKQMAV
jgi:predicted regulator of amino acid metabolism with ACT domain